MDSERHFSSKEAEAAGHKTFFGRRVMEENKKEKNKIFHWLIEIAILLGVWGFENPFIAYNDILFQSLLIV
ncbi:hypothetical protein U9M73_12925 [Paenibacillus phoenicis]|uniref:Uncharacterized protein n=1 Tax=Paenibacillus phoenicis TaxID=554117 RepID=A0ABU5PLT7_9BACL|nr:hypothetical protein [Paenibacillus phoenicis]MEA3570888.1 hypothetical protein [Paenibacillus phoenicis]